MDQPAVKTRDASRRYKAGDTVTFDISTTLDADPQLRIAAWLNRDGGSDLKSGLPTFALLSVCARIAPRKFEISGQLPALQDGLYHVTRLDMFIGDASKTVNISDADARIEIAGNEGPRFPDIADVDPKQ